MWEGSICCTSSSKGWASTASFIEDGWGQEMRSFRSQSLLVNRLSGERLPESWLAAALNGLHLIGWKRYAVCGLRSWWFRWLLTVSREIEGAGPTVEKWREWLTRTVVERKHRTPSCRDRAEARPDGVHNTPAPENWPIYTHQVSGSS